MRTAYVLPDETFAYAVTDTERTFRFYGREQVPVTKRFLVPMDVGEGLACCMRPLHLLDITLGRQLGWVVRRLTLRRRRRRLC